MSIPPLHTLSPARFETPAILRRVTTASRQLAELKGAAATIPHQGILINTLALQEAKDSSAIENIVTTHDELFRDSASPDETHSPATKEVARYGRALRVGFERVRDSGLLLNQDILRIQAELEQNDAGFRKLPGTTLRASDGQVVYTPPQSYDEIVGGMSDLERFMNDVPSPSAFSALRQGPAAANVLADAAARNGTPEPALTREALADKPLDSMASTIYGGRPGTPMAPWKAMLSEAEALWIAQQLMAGFPEPEKDSR